MAKRGLAALFPAQPVTAVALDARESFPTSTHNVATALGRLVVADVDHLDVPLLLAGGDDLLGLAQRLDELVEVAFVEHRRAARNGVASALAAIRLAQLHDDGALIAVEVDGALLVLEHNALADVLGADVDQAHDLLFIAHVSPASFSISSSVERSWSSRFHMASVARSSKPEIIGRGV